jgi:hypothetical protein
MKIAFATGDGIHVDEQFRRASRLDVHEVTAEGHRLDRTCTFAADRSVKTDERLSAIEGVSIVFGVAYGPSSVLRLARRGVRAATAPAGTPIATVLERLVRTEREAAAAPDGPPPADPAAR